MDDQILTGQEVKNEILHVDVKCIREIVRLNSLDEGVETFVSKSKIKEAGLGLQELKYTRLWLLMSLINDSSARNLSRLVVENVMFIHVLRPIERQEIIVPYFDTSFPCCSTKPSQRTGVLRASVRDAFWSTP